LLYCIVKNIYFRLIVEKNLYFALAHSSLVYCIEIYGRANHSVLNPLKVKCNCLLRLLQDKPKMYNTKDLYSNYNTLTVHLLFKLSVLKLMHRFIYNRHVLPKVIAELFSSNNDIHAYNTRFRHEFNLQSSCCVKSLSYIGPSLWLKLPRDVTTCFNINTFSKLCKNKLFDEI